MKRHNVRQDNRRQDMQKGQNSEYFFFYLSSFSSRTIAQKNAAGQWAADARLVGLTWGPLAPSYIALNALFHVIFALNRALGDVFHIASFG